MPLFGGFCPFAPACHLGVGTWVRTTGAESAHRPRFSSSFPMAFYIRFCFLEVFSSTFSRTYCISKIINC